MSEWQGIKRLFADYAVEYDNIVTAYSGGVDSAVVLRLAVEAAAGSGVKVFAVTARTLLHPAGEWQEAQRSAAELGAIHRLVDVDELREAGIENNPVNRCYLCKKTIFEKIKDAVLAELPETGKTLFLDGTNADDLKEYRPGLKAVAELGIVSPLAAAGLTKAAVRRLAAEYGLSAAQKPSAPCLITRIPYGQKVDYELLRRIDDGERFIRSRGFCNVRLRCHGSIARLEVDAIDLPKLALPEERSAVIGYLKSLGFDYITLDLEGFRSGSMDISLKN
ncbi:MAG: ATP-dependent sacrificial sulfur transferase LarE [Selenomonadaceae bacterium]|nr:ATP-dependent sacrificial sulfur transferase LarE [Selenomonadaceae bacterium]